VRQWDVGARKFVWELKIPAEARCTAVSPDSQLLVKGFGDGTAHVLETKTGNVLVTVNAGKQAVRSVCFSPDSGAFLTGGDDGVVWLWRARDGERLQKFPGHRGAVVSAAFSQDGRRVVTAGADGAARVWDAGTGRELRALTGPNFRSKFVRFLPGTGEALIVDSEILRVDLTSGQVRQRIKPSHKASAADYSPAAGLFATGHALSVELWDRNGKLLRTLQGIGYGTFFTHLIEGGARVVTCSTKILDVWDTRTGSHVRQIQHLVGSSDGEFSSASVSPDGTRVAVGLRKTGSPDRKRPASVTGMFRVWDIGTGQALPVRGDCAGRATCVGFGPGENRLLVGDDSGRVSIWSLDRSTSVGAFAGHDSPVTCVAVSPDGTRVLSGDEKGGVCLWDGRTFALIDRRADHATKVSAVAFSADGLWLYSGSEFDPIVRWKPEERPSEPVYKGHADRLVWAALSPDGKTVSTGGADGRVILWDAASGEVARLLRSHPGAARGFFSRDGTEILAVGAGELFTWNAATGERTRRFTLEGMSPACAVLSADGQYVAVGDRDGKVLVVESATGKQIRQFRFRYGAVAAVAFSADGSTVVAASSCDARAKWDVRGGELVVETARPFGEPVGVAFTTPGRRLLTLSGTTVWLWDCDTGRALQRFERILVRNDFRASKPADYLLLSPDGEYLLAVAPDCTGQVRKVKDGEVVRRWGRESGLASLFSGKSNLTWHRDNLGAIWGWIGAGGGSARDRADQPRPSAVSLSGSGAFGAFEAGGGKTVLRRLAGSEGIEVDRPVSLFTASADLTRSLARDQKELRLVDLRGQGGKLVARLGEHKNAVQSLALSPDSKFAYTDDGTVHQWDASDGRPMRSFGASPVRNLLDVVKGVRLSPDGRWAAFLVDRSGQAGVWDLWKRQEVVRVSPSTGAAGLRFHPGPPALTYRARDESLRRVDLVSRQETLLAAGRPAARGVVFAPDGQYVAVVAGAERKKVVLRDLTGRGGARELAGVVVPVNAISFSRDGRHLLTAGGNSEGNRIVCAWDVATGQMVRAEGLAEGLAGWVHALGVSPTGGLVAAGSDGPGPTVQVWAPQAGNPLGALAGQVGSGPVSALTFSSDDRYLATVEAGVRNRPPGQQKRHVRIWDWRQAKQIGEIAPSTSDYQCVAFSPDGKALAVGLAGGEICLFEFPGLRLVRRLAGHRGAVTGMRFSADGRLLATGGIDRTVRLWNPATGEPTRELSWHAGPLLAVDFHPDGKTVLTASPDDPAVGWSLGNGSARAYWDGLSDDVVPHVTPDGRRAILSHRGGLIRVWDFERGAETARFVDHATESGGLLQPLVWISTNGRFVFSVAAKEACYWDIATGAKQWRVKIDTVPHDIVAAFSPDDLTLAVVKRYKSPPRARLIDTKSGGQAEFPMEGETGEVKALAFSPDGKLLATGGTRVAVWDARSGRKISSHRAHAPGGPAEFVAFTADGAAVLSASWMLPVFAWDLKEKRGRPLFGGHVTSVRAFAVSANGGRLITGGGGDQSACVWDTATGGLLQQFFGHNSDVTAVALSPDGALALTGGGGAVRLWDVQSGKEIDRFEGHGGPVAAVDYSPRERCALVGMTDGRLWEWHPGPGGRLVLRRRYDGPVIGAMFSSDGLRLFARTTRLIEEIEAFSNQARNSFPIPAAPGLELDWNAPGAGFDPSGEPNDEHIVPRFRGPSPGGSSVAVRLRASTRNVAAVNQVEFSSDGKGLVTRQGPSGRGNGTLKYPSNSATWTWAFESNDVQGGPWRDMVDQPSPLDLASDASRVLVSRGAAWKVRYAGGSDTWVFDRLPSLAADKLVSCTALSPDGRLLVTGHEDGGVGLWDVALGGRRGRLTPHGARVLFVAYDPSNSRVASLAAGGELAVSSLATGQALFRVQVGTDVSRVGFSPRGRFVITGTRWANHPIDEWFRPELISVGLGYGPAHPYIMAVTLHDAATGKVVRPFQYQGACAFSPDEKTMLTVDQKTVIEVDNSGYGSYFGELRPGRVVSVRDVVTGNILRQLAGHDDGVSAVAFSRDGKYILTGSWDNTARLWDAGSGEVKARYVGHSDYVGAVDMSPDGRWVCTGSWDGTARLWDAATGAEKCQLVTFPDGTWAVVDPEGRYDASNAGDVPGLHWVVGDEPVELSQLKDRYFDPALLAKHLGLATGLDGSQKVSPRDVASLAAAQLHPAVEIDPSAAARGELQVRLTDRGGGFGRVVVLVNGKEFWEIPPDALPRGPDPKTRRLVKDLSRDARVEPGKPNRVEVQAYNADGKLRSRGSEAYFLGPGPADDRPPELWAVAVGVSQYANPALALRYAAKDARNFARAVELAGLRLFAEDGRHPGRVHLSVLTTLEEVPDRRPTKANVARELAAVRDKARPGDVVVVYLSGHGVSRPEGDHEQYYFLTTSAGSADLSDAAVRERDGVSGRELAELMKACPARKQALVLDTCAAGQAAMLVGIQRAAFGERRRALERVKDRTGTFILAGCAADAVSYEAGRYGQGVLTYSLLMGMRGAALIDGQQVDVSTLFNFAADEVPELVRDLGGVQRPQLAAPGAGASFPIGLLTSEDRQGIPLLEPRKVLLPSSFQGPQEKFLDDYLDLKGRVDERARDAAGRDGTAPLFVPSQEAMPGAYRLLGQYQSTGSRVTVKLSLLRAKEPVGQFTVEGDEAGPEVIATRIAAEVQRRLAELK
jgi:WD40 repeat protein